MRGRWAGLGAVPLAADVTPYVTINGMNGNVEIDQYQQVTTAVKAARLKAGLTQAQLAAAASIGEGYAALIDRGYVPPAKTRARIASALGVNPSALWEGADDA